MGAVPLEQIIRHLRLNPHVAGVALSDEQLLERFVTTRDEAAFEVLLWRHGPMVLDVGRRLLRHREDIEDTFQATFWTLARKAGSIRKQPALASWIHQVAYRIALDARILLARRTGREKSVSPIPDVASPHDVSAYAARNEIGLAVDAEIVQLPRKYREPVVLCYLQGMTQEQAARALGWAKGTVSTRLIRARQLLRQKLAGRFGQDASPAILTAALAKSANLPTLVDQTVRAVVAVPTATGTIPLISANALRLAEGALRAMAVTKLKSLAVVVLMTAALGAGAGLLSFQIIRASAWGDEIAAVSSQGPTKPEQNRLDQYGDALPPQALARMGSVRWRHSHAAVGIVFSHDGKTVATSGGQDGFIHLWEADSGRELVRLSCGPLNLKGLSLSPDGRLLATAGYFLDPERREICGRLELWDFATYKRLLQIENRQWRPSSIAFAPDGKSLATGSEDGGVHLWDSVTGKEQLHIEAHEQGVFSVVFAPNGRTLASASTDYTIRLWDSASGKERCKLEMHEHRFCSRLTFSPDGNSLLGVERRFNRSTGIGSNDVVIWDVNTGKERRRLVGEEYGGERVPVNLPVNLLDVAFSPDGNMIVSTENDRALVFWDADSGRCVRKIKGPPSGASRLAFSPDGKTLISGGFDQAVYRWDVATGQELSSVAESHQSSISHILFTPIGDTLITSGDDGTIRLWDPVTGWQLRQLAAHDSWVRALALSPNGKTLASSSLDDTVRLWEIATGKELHRLPGHGKLGGQRRLAFGREGKVLASWGDDWRLAVWDAATGKMISRTQPRLSGMEDLPADGDKANRNAKRDQLGLETTAVLTPDGAALLIGTSKQLHLVDVATGQERISFPAVPFVDQLAASVDGKLLATPTQRAIRICDLASGADVLKITESSPIDALAFSPDRQTLAGSLHVGCKEGKVRLWELRTGQVLLELACPSNAVSLAFSPNGKTLATGLADSTALVWNLMPPEVSARAASAKELQAESMEQMWVDLSSTDARKASAARWIFETVPPQTIAWFKSRLRPVADIDPKHIQRLITDLNSEHFEARERASQELEHLGSMVTAALRQTLEQNPSSEVRRRIEALLAVSPALIRSHEVLRRSRAIQILESIGSRDARQLLHDLSQGSPAARETVEARAALERLAKRPPHAANLRSSP